MSLGANEAPIFELVEYMKSNVDEDLLKKVYLEWPNHNEDLEMPCASVMTVGNPEYRSMMPTLISNINGVSTYAIGEYDLVLQVDLWAEYKETRGFLMEAMFDLFDKQFQDSGRSLGASLTLTQYFNTIARYDLTGYTYNDNEEGSQRDEWRSRLRVLVNFQRIITKTESTMDNIAISPSAPDPGIEVDTDIVIVI